MTPNAHDFLVGAGMLLTAGVARSEGASCAIIPAYVPPSAPMITPVVFESVTIASSMTKIRQRSSVVLSKLAEELPEHERAAALTAKA